MKKIVVVDIDGTIADCSERQIHADNENWDLFFSLCNEDEPIKNVIELVQLLGLKYHIVFCSSRPESVRQLTGEWIELYIDTMRWKYMYDVLLSHDDDPREDHIKKPELLENAGIFLDEIFLVLEDRDIMVSTWRELGLTCLQVADGNF